MTYKTVEEATRKTAENLGCTVENLDNAVNHFKKIDEEEANRPREKLDKIINELETLEYLYGSIPNVDPEALPNIRNVIEK